LGSLDPRKDRLKATLAGRAAGFSRIEFSDFWETAAARRQARAHWRAIEAGRPPAPLPPEDLRYVLQTSMPMVVGSAVWEIPLLAVHSIEVDGALISLFGDVWSEESPGVLVSEIRDELGAPMLRVRRGTSFGISGYSIFLAQSVENLSGQELSVRWIQYGPPELRVERTRYIDTRRFHFGYLLPPTRDPSQRLVIAENDQMVDVSAVSKAASRRENLLWPNAESRAQQLDASWFGSTNRYFALAVFAPDPSIDPLKGSLSMGRSVELVKAELAVDPTGQQHVLTELHSPVRPLPAGATATFDLGVFAGPLDPRLLKEVQPYEVLNLSGLIVYLISGCCSFCTFAWLAQLLLTFLTLLHDYVVFDWGLAIIALVLVVRTILHPLTKRAQISLQKTTKAMGELRPELEKLQQRYKDDPTRLQQETMRLYREKKINPVGCAAGLLPTFLQMPIWIALYAMLYFAFQLRQEPAFFGVFQLLGGWPFLADLSAADHFFGEFAEPRSILFFTVSGINLLPILMGVVFYVQQKYLTPPSAVPLSPEQEQQQKIMKFMMVVMFPVMMYTAPSGLTLYWLTSSLIGIFEIQLIRRHIKQEELLPPSEKPKKKQDFMGRMYEEAMRRAQQKQAERRTPPKKYKERE
jgi:YidC/Oxa1 family membrane protein insertase